MKKRIERTLLKKRTKINKVRRTETNLVEKKNKDYQMKENINDQRKENKDEGLSGVVLSISTQTDQRLCNKRLG